MAIYVLFSTLYYNPKWVGSLNKTTYVKSIQLQEMFMPYIVLYFIIKLHLITSNHIIA